MIIRPLSTFELVENNNFKAVDFKKSTAFFIFCLVWPGIKDENFIKNLIFAY